VKKFFVVGMLLSALAWVTSATASAPIVTPGGGEGCVSPQGDTCTYVPTRTGGYAAEGANWTLTVTIAAPVGDPRDTNKDGKLRYVFTPANGPKQGCGFIAAGSTATTLAGANSGIAVGNPFPGASDAVVGSRNDCPTGLVTASNPAYTPVD
jgi:hypothetical protein